MKLFKKLYIEITNVCNLSCRFCPKTQRSSEFMSINAFDRILDEIKGHTKYLYFHVKGEPLLHPQLGDFLDRSFEKDYLVNLTTNGTLISEVADMLLMKPALRKISFSLHSFDENDMPDTLDRDVYVMEILSFTRKAVKETGILVELRLWNLEKEKLENTQGQKNQNMLALIERELGLPYKIEEEVNKGHGIKISEQIYLSQSHEFQWPDINLDKENPRGFCYGLRNQIAILVDGTVVPCCLDGEGVVNLGNIHEKHFRDIVESQRAKKIVDGFTRREATEELCRKCGFRERFNG